MDFDKLSNRVIGCAPGVHKYSGPGLLESTYEQFLARELSLNEISYKVQVPLPVIYKGIQPDCGYRLDLLIEDSMIVELKSVDEVTGINNTQLLTYMKLSKIP